MVRGDITTRIHANHVFSSVGPKLARETPDQTAENIIKPHIYLTSPVIKNILKNSTPLLHHWIQFSSKIKKYVRLFTNRVWPTSTTRPRFVFCMDILRLSTRQPRALPICTAIYEVTIVIKWKHFPRNWPYVRGILRSPMNSPHKGQWRGALMGFFICVWINDWVNNGEAGDLRRYCAHYDVIVMCSLRGGGGGGGFKTRMSS